MLQEVLARADNPIEHATRRPVAARHSWQQGCFSLSNINELRVEMRLIKPQVTGAIPRGDTTIERARI